MTKVKIFRCLHNIIRENIFRHRLAKMFTSVHSSFYAQDCFALRSDTDEDRYILFFVRIRKDGVNHLRISPHGGSSVDVRFEALDDIAPALAEAARCW